MYNKVHVELTTHDRGNTVTGLDCKLAERMGQFAEEAGDVGLEKGSA